MTFKFCGAIGCTSLIPSIHAFCKKHWLMAPKKTRRRVWAELKPYGARYIFDVYETLFKPIAKAELASLKKDCQHWYEMFIKQEGEIRAARLGPHAQAAYVAAGMAVEEMMKRREGTWS